MWQQVFWLALQYTSHLLPASQMSLGCCRVVLPRHSRGSCASRMIHTAVTGKEISMNVGSVDKKTANDSRRLLLQHATLCWLNSVQVLTDMFWPTRVLILGSYVCVCVCVCVRGRGRVEFRCVLQAVMAFFIMR